MVHIKYALGFAAISSTLGSATPRSLPRALDLEAFIAVERPIALQGALNNIGPNGSMVPGAGAGFVVASPSKVNPNCETYSDIQKDMD